MQFRDGGHVQSASLPELMQIKIKFRKWGLFSVHKKNAKWQRVAFIRQGVYTVVDVIGSRHVPAFWVDASRVTARWVNCDQALAAECSKATRAVKRHAPSREEPFLFWVVMDAQKWSSQGEPAE